MVTRLLLVCMCCQTLCLAGPTPVREAMSQPFAAETGPASVAAQPAITHDPIDDHASPVVVPIPAAVIPGLLTLGWATWIGRKPKAKLRR